MDPTFSFLISSESKKKKLRYECLSEERASNVHKTWTEVSFSVPHFLQIGLSLSPITYKCHLRVLRPVRRPMTNLDCVLLKDNNHALVAKSGPEIRYCLCSTLTVPRTASLPREKPQSSASTVQKKLTTFWEGNIRNPKCTLWAYWGDFSWQTAFETWWYTRRNQISSFAEKDESI